MAFLDNTGVARLVTDLKSKFATLVSGAVAVVQGGTGKTTHTTNAVLTGNGANAVNNVATADGALYATAANGAAQFGTLPVAQGGTNGTTEAEARASLKVPVNSSIATVESATATANHAVGDHFMLNDKLKTATAAIATGETISATNSADATVQSQIDTLRDSVSHGQCATGSYMGITVTAYRFGKVVFVILKGTTTKAIGISDWYAGNSIASNLPKPIEEFWHQTRVGITLERYSVYVVSNGNIDFIARDSIPAGRALATSFTYIAQ